jgi:hypothetical protein
MPIHYRPPLLGSDSKHTAFSYLPYQASGNRAQGWSEVPRREATKSGGARHVQPMLILHSMSSWMSCEIAGETLLAGCGLGIATFPFSWIEIGRSFDSRNGAGPNNCLYSWISAHICAYLNDCQ